MCRDGKIGTWRHRWDLYVVYSRRTDSGVVLTYIVSATHACMCVARTSRCDDVRVEQCRRAVVWRVKPTETSQYCTEVVEGNVRGLRGSGMCEKEEVMRAVSRCTGLTQCRFSSVGRAYGF